MDSILVHSIMTQKMLILVYLFKEVGRQHVEMDMKSVIFQPQKQHKHVPTMKSAKSLFDIIVILEALKLTIIMVSTNRSVFSDLILTLAKCVKASVCTVHMRPNARMCTLFPTGRKHVAQCTGCCTGAGCATSYGPTFVKTEDNVQDGNLNKFGAVNAV